jgi:TolA-binding protein
VFGTPKVGQSLKSISRFLGISLIFYLMTGFLGTQAISQNLPVPNSNIAEEQDYAFAHGLFRDGLFQLSAEQFDRFVKKYPLSVRVQDARFLHADCFFQLAQYPIAISEFTKFVSEYPVSILSDNARFRLGDAYGKLKRNRDAVESYKSILDHPVNPSVAGEAAYWIGEIYFKEADYNNALKYYALSYEGYPGNRLQDYAVYSAGWTNQTRGDYAKAAEWYRIIIEKFPKSSLAPSSRVKIGECYYYAKEYPRAIEELTAAKASIDSVALRGEADYLIGESYYNLGQYDKAQKQYELFLKEYPQHRLSGEVQYALGWTLFKEKQFAASAETFGRLTAADGQLAEAAQYRKGMAEKLAGNKDAALETFQKLYQLNPKGGYADNALYDAGGILFDQKKTNAAIANFRRIVTQYDSSDVLADATMMLGECYVSTESYDSAKACYEKVLASEGLSFETKVNSMYQVARCSFKLKQFKDAATGFSMFLAAYPEHPKSVEALYWQAESEYQGGDLQNALKHYKLIAAAAKNPRREEGMYGIGWSYYKLGDYPKAIDAFEKLVVAYPSGKFSFDARLRLGDCYFKQKDFKKAAGAYRTVVRLFPKNDGADYALYQLGQTYYRSDDHEQAADQFTALIKTYPTSTLADAAQYALGWMKFQRKDYLAAIKEFQTTVTTYPSSPLAPRAYYSIGDSYYNLRQYGAAEKSYREVLQKFPKSPLAADALTGIQYSLVAQGKSKEAVGTIDQYVKENPSSPNNEQFEMKKAELLFSQKQYVDAAREYRSFAIRHAESGLSPQALYWCGRSLEEADSALSAVQAFEQAADALRAPIEIKGNALLEAARICLKRKDYERSFKILDRAEKDLAGSDFAPEAAYLKGYVLLENGATDDAKAKFDFVVSKYPTRVEADKARIGLTRIALQEKEFAAGQTLAQQVATSRTDEIGAEAQYFSGLIYSRSNDWQNAITAFLRVRYVFPSHETWLAKAYIGLGEAYEKTNDLIKARESYQQVLKILKSGDDFDEASKQLKRLGQ